MNKRIQIDPKKAIFLAALFVAVATPYLVFSSHEHSIFVDEDASGEQNGSKSHPFRTISRAMEKADDNDVIRVANGEYRENITVRKGVKIVGHDKDKTIIKAKNDDKPVVKMRNHSEINNLTVRDGRDGVNVEQDGRVKIIDCIIKDNDEDGIDIEKGSLNAIQQIVIFNTKIKNNGWAGIYSEKRNIAIVKSEIENNGRNGIDLEAGARVWFGDNLIKDNVLNGIKLRLDGSSIFTKGNEIRENRENGIEIIAFGGNGRINIEKTKIVENSRYAIAKIAAGFSANSENYWNGKITFQGLPNNIWGNTLGQISPIIITQ